MSLSVLHGGIRLRAWLLVLLLSLTPIVGLRAQSEREGNFEAPVTALRLQRIPTKADRAALARVGIVLQSFRAMEGDAVVYWAQVPKGALEKLRQERDGQGQQLFSLPRLRGGVSLQLAPVETTWQQKVQPELLLGQTPEWAKVRPGVAKVGVELAPGTTGDALAELARPLGCTVLFYNEPLHSGWLELPLAKLSALASWPKLQWVCYIPAPEELMNETGAAMIGARYLQSTLPGKPALTGRGVNVAIFDGNVYPHPDLGNRLHWQEHTNDSDHGQHVAGTVAGAGVLDPKAKGMAPEAELYTWNFNSGNTQGKMALAFTKFKCILTQNSYGRGISKTACNDPKKNYRYDYGAKEIDKLSLLHPEMAHIYAAGNYQNNCTARGGYYTATRVSKNIITVGALDAAERMTSFSSWGPAPDGRLIPSLCAQGDQVYSTVYNNGYDFKSGTSMACPSISGLTAQLYQLYRAENAGSNPKFIVIKNALLNTARDKGRVGPDFQYGYGVADGVAAANLIKEKRFAEGKVSQGEVKDHTINVPEGVAGLKVMLVWHDAPGQGPAGDLIDDLDLTVRGNRVFRPYILDPANPTSPATTGEDHLNVQEQVYIPNPQAGPLTVKVSGSRVLSESVDYSLSWEYVYPNALRILYPNGGEEINVMDLSLIRWQGALSHLPLNIEVSYDGGKNFSKLCTVEKPASGKLEMLPYKDSKALYDTAKVSQSALLRIVQGTHFDVSDAPFKLSARPKSVKLLPLVGSDKFKLSWSELKMPVKEYKVYKVVPATGQRAELATLPASALSYTGDATACPPGSMVALQPIFDDFPGLVSRALYAEYVRPIPLGSADFPVSKRVEWTPGNGYSLLVFPKNIASGKVTGGYIAIKAYSDGADFWDKGSTSNDPFEHTDYVTRASFCVDLSKVTPNIVCKIPMVLAPCSNDGIAQARLMVSESLGGTRSPLIPQGQTSPVVMPFLKPDGNYGAALPTWDLSPYAGKTIYLDLELVVKGGNGKSTDEMLIGNVNFIQSNVGEVKIGVAAIIPPAHSAKLGNNESVSVKIRNYALEPFEGSATIKVASADGQEKTKLLTNITIPATTTYDAQQITGFDFSTPGITYQLSATVAVDQNKDTEHQLRKAIVTNLSGMIIPQKNTVEELVQADKRIFCDNGGPNGNFTYEKKTKNYSVNIGPADPEARVVLEIETLKLNNGQKLEVTIENDKKPIFVGQGTLAKPMQLVAPAGKKLLVKFYSLTDKSAPGFFGHAWQTTDATLPQGGNNLVSINSVSVLEPVVDGKPQVNISYTVNCDGVSEVAVGYTIDGELAASASYSTKNQPANLTKGPHEVTVHTDYVLPRKPAVYMVGAIVIASSDQGDDPVLDDNYIKEMRYYASSDKRPYELFYDDYPKCIFEGYFLHDNIQITNVKVGQKQHASDYVDYPRPRHTSFYRDVAFPVYQSVNEGKFDLVVTWHRETITKFYDKEVKVIAWADWDNQLKYSTKLGEMVASPTSSDKEGSLTIPVTLPSTVKPGKYHIRIIAANNAPDLAPDMHGEKHGGESEDYTIHVLATEPVDIAVMGLALAADGHVVLTLRNSAVATIEKVNVKTVIDNKPAVAQILTVNLAPGQEKNFDLSAALPNDAYGEHTVDVEVILKDDINPDDNKFTLTVGRPRPVQPGVSYFLAFDGQDDRLDVDFPQLTESNLSSATYEAWICPRTYGSYSSVGFGRIFSGKDVNIFLNGEPGFYTNAHALIVATPAGNYMSDANSITLNAWTHVAVVVDGNTKQPTLYLNGQQVPLTLKGDPKSGSFSNAGKPLYMGNSDKLDRQFNGLMDELRVWNITRTTKEVADNIFRHLPSSTAGLLVNMSFNEGDYCAATAVNDGATSMANLTNMAVSGELSAWVKEADPSLLHVAIEGVTNPQWIKEGNTWTVELADDAIFTNNQAGLTFSPYYYGTKVLDASKNNVTNTKPQLPKAGATYTLTAQWPGWSATGKQVNLTLKPKIGLSSSEAELKSLQLTFGSSVENVTVASNMLASYTAPVDLSAVPFTASISDNATLAVNGKPVATTGATIDLSSSKAVLEVLAQNKRDRSFYTLTVVPKASITWDLQSTNTLSYGDPIKPFEATTANGLPVYYVSSNPDVVAISGNQAVITGTGSVTIKASCDPTTASAKPVEKSFTVQKRVLTVTAPTLECDYFAPIPEIELAYTNFAPGEDKTSLAPMVKFSTRCEARQGSAARSYPIEVNVENGDADPHYTFKTVNGLLTIKTVSTFNVVFKLTLNGAPLTVDATLTINGKTYTVKNGISDPITLPARELEVTVTCEKTEPYKGKLTPSKDGELPIALSELPKEYTLTFNTDGKGKLQVNSALSLTYEEKVMAGQNAKHEVLAKANPGYKFANWTGTPADPANPSSVKLLVENVQGDATYTAHFQVATYSLKYSAGDHGTITGKANQTDIPYQGSGEAVTVVPTPPYLFLNWSDGRTDNPRIDKNVSANVNVTAQYVKPLELPYTQDFNAAKACPEGWSSVRTMGNEAEWIFDERLSTYTLEGATGNLAAANLRESNYGDAEVELLSPRFTSLGLSTVNISFLHKCNIDFGGKLSLLYTTDDGNTWKPVATIESTSKAETFRADVPELANCSLFRLKWVASGRASTYWLFDDLNVSAKPLPATVKVTYNVPSQAKLVVDGQEYTGSFSKEITTLSNAPSVEVVVTDPNYYFLKWSDGLTSNPRTDKAVVRSTEVSAILQEDCSKASPLAIPAHIAFEDNTYGCWTVSTSSPKLAWVFGAVGQSDYGKSLALQSTLDDGEKATVEAISPIFNCSGKTKVYVSFFFNYMRKFSMATIDENANFTLSVSTDGGATWRELLSKKEFAISDFYSAEVDAPTDKVRFKWTATAIGSIRTFSIDEIKVAEFPTYALKYYTSSKYENYEYIYFGTIEGADFQMIDQGKDAQQVKAIPYLGYIFKEWKDNHSTNPVRQDKNIQANLSVEAVMEPADPATLHKVTFTVFEKDSNPRKLLKDATVNFPADYFVTDDQGVAVAENVNDDTDFHYTVEMDGYDTFKGDLKLNGADISIDVPMVKSTTPSTYTVTITVQDESGQALEGQLVKLGDQTENTNAQGEATFTLADGDYPLTIERTGYQTVTETLKVSGANLAKSYKLVKAAAPTTHTVTITVQDENGQPLQDQPVKLGDQTLNTNAQGEATFTLADGDYPLTIERTDYQTVSETLKVSGANLAKSYKLVKAAAPTTHTVAITVQDEHGQALQGQPVKLGDQTVNTNAQGEAAFTLADGDYPLTIERTDYKTISETLTVSGANLAKSYKLAKVSTPSTPSPVEAQALAQVLLYPNPATDHVVLENVEGIRFVELRNAMGHLLHRQELTGEHELTLSVRTLPEGVVYLILSDGQSVRTLQLLVQR